MNSSEKSVHKPEAPKDLVITVTLPEGTKGVTSYLGKTYHHTLSLEQVLRLKVAQTKRVFEIGLVISVHPQKRQLTVKVPGNRAAWVKRVLLGQAPPAPGETKFEEVKP